MRLKAIVMHTKTVLKHKNEVFKLCFRCGMPFRGMVHDLSKFSSTEFKESIRFYSGIRSPLSDARKTDGYSLAWIHHKNKNKHHIEYWFDFYNKQQVVMPYCYAVEYICDKIAAAKTYNGCYTGKGIVEYIKEEHELANINPKLQLFFCTIFKQIDSLGEKNVLNRKHLKQQYKNIVVLESKEKEEVKTDSVINEDHSLSM